MKKVKLISVNLLIQLLFFWLILSTQWGKSGGDMATWVFYFGIILLHLLISFAWVKKGFIFRQILLGLFLGVLVNMISFNILENYRIRQFNKKNPYNTSLYIDSDSISYSYAYKDINLIDQNNINFKKIRNLNLSSTGLKTLPQFIFLFDSLQSLDLAANIGLNIDSVVIALENVGTLKRLNLTNCGLEKLPYSICQLKNLVHLDLSMNPKLNIDTIVVRLSKLNNLNSLYLGGNEIKALPNSFKKLDRLEVLFLRSNKFESYPAIIDSLPNLLELYIGNNSFDIKSIEDKAYRINN